ncbi:MAG: DNA polymerase III subunit beta [Gammaproteobacteria bacterium]|nr:DNA polymerase III subunit beta [Gammaproteobacteria bacterium]
MHITLQREDILKPLSYVAGVVEKRQTLPILSFILLRQDNSEVTLTGTDLEVEIVARVKTEHSTGGELTLPARKLLDICRALPEGAVIDIRKEDEKASVKSGKSRFSLLTLPAVDFPNIQTSQWNQSISVSQAVLRNLLQQTHFCMAQQDTRYFLNGLLVELGSGQLRVVGTDGHRMAISESKLGGNVQDLKQIIIPRKGIHEFMRLLEDVSDPVELQLNTNHVRARTADFVFTSKLIDGKYPNYTKVIPALQNKLVHVEREALRESLSRAAILSNEKYRGVRLTLVNKGLKISAHNPEQEEAQEEILADYGGEAMEIGFNVSYMLEAISALHSQQVVIGLTDANSSCTISSPDTKTPLYVIMPMRL